MRKACEAVGGLLVFLGLMGIAHQVVGWFDKWAVVRYLPFLDDYELYVNLGMAVVGFVLVVFAEESGKRPPGPLISGADRARPE